MSERGGEVKLETGGFLDLTGEYLMYFSLEGEDEKICWVVLGEVSWM